MSITFEKIRQSVQENKLSLSGMRVNDEDILIVCNYLTSNPNITSLDLSANKITNEGAKIIAAIPSLIQVNLSFNEIIGDETAEVFAANTYLDSINFFGNSIGVEGGKALLSNRKEMSPGVYKSYNSSILSVSFMAFGGGIFLAGIVAVIMAMTVATYASAGIVGVIGIVAAFCGLCLFVAFGKYHRETTLDNPLSISDQQAAAVLSPKEMVYLYGRNIKGTFFDGFIGIENKYVAPFVWLGHLFLLPLSLTLGAGIKTLIDMSTREEQPPEQMVQLNDKIDRLNSLEMRSLITELTSYNPKSISSRGLKATLETIAIDTASASEKAQEDKKWLLQINQLTSIENPEPLNDYTKEYISSTKLDVNHQEELTFFIENKSAICDNQKLRMQKNSIQNYLGAEKNAGKQLHNIVHHHFFPVKIETLQLDNERDCSLTSSGHSLCLFH